MNTENNTTEVYVNKTVNILNSCQRQILCQALSITANSSDSDIKRTVQSIYSIFGHDAVKGALDRVSRKLGYKLTITDIRDYI